MTKTYKIVFAPSAEIEILNIYSYILNDNPINAKKWLADLREACNSLGFFPNRNPEFKFSSQSTRQMIFNKNIRIVYAIAEDTISIVHCYRCEQNLA